MGFAGNDSPELIPSLIGRLKPNETKEDHPRDYYVGYAAQEKREYLNIRNPICSGTITNWDEIELVWNHIFQTELHVSTNERPILMSEAPYSSNSQREKIVQMMFETFNVPSYYTYASPILAMYASGTTTGCIVESGEGLTTVMPIYNGISIPGATIRDGMSGQDVTDYFAEKLSKHGPSLISSSDRSTARELKERLGYILKDYDHGNSAMVDEDTTVNRTYELPDSTVLTVGRERFQCPEIIFRPCMWGRQSPGVHEMVHIAIKKCEVDVRRAMWDNVVLAGGNTMFKGYQDRLLKEMACLAPSTVMLHVVAAPERRISVWIGGSILGSLSSMNDKWITAADYDEWGPSVVDTKCKVCF